MNNIPIVMIGGGGHASVLLDILLKQNKQVIAVISPEDISSRRVFDNIPRLTKNEDIKQFAVDKVALVNGIGVLPKSSLKYSINEYYLSLGYKFCSVIADDAIISPYALVKEGVQILSNAIINSGSVIGNHTIINTGALIEHDCVIGNYNHIAPRVTLCGQVTTHDKVFIGANAVVIQNLNIGMETVIGAGTIVTQNINPKTMLFSNMKNIYHDIEVS